MSPTFQGRDLPGLHEDANVVSDRSQRTFFRLTKATLGLGVLAAVGGAVTLEAEVGSQQIDMAAVGSVVAFIGMFVITVYIQVAHPERVWYQARALAESVKTLAWLYSVRGGEYAIDDPEAEPRFLEELRDIVDSMKLLDMSSSAPLRRSQITEPMRALRQASLLDRYEGYLKGRIEDQYMWYRRKARFNSQRAKRLILVSLVIQLGGVVAGVFIAFTSFDIDLLGIMAATAAAVTALQQARDHESLAEAYAVTARDLTLVLAEAEATKASPDGFTEPMWATFVDSAEQAISREHTVWRARRGVAPRR